jgi:hypothetical protein
MTLTTIEKKLFRDIKNQISSLHTSDVIDELKIFYEEDIEIRISNINNLISLLKKEKKALNSLK